jgi:hypothetical protein
VNKIYYSKKDTWIVVIHTIIIVCCLLASFFIFKKDTNRLISLVVVLFLTGIGVAFPSWVLINTYYQIKEGILIIKSGPLQWHITLDSIKSITPTRDTTSSPALSFDRLRIEYGQYNSILVSPKDKENFLSDIKQNAKRVA